MCVATGLSVCLCSTKRWKWFSKNNLHIVCRRCIKRPPWPLPEINILIFDYHNCSLIYYFKFVVTCSRRDFLDDNSSSNDATNLANRIQSVRTATTDLITEIQYPTHSWTPRLQPHNRIPPLSARRGAVPTCRRWWGDGRSACRCRAARSSDSGCSGGVFGGGGGIGAED